MNLPIDDILSELKTTLAANSCLILQAPPGAGKTTRVPLALLDEDWLDRKKILILEPRRLAATNAARFMAGQLGEEVGTTVGYTIRYERKVSHATRIEVVTEGILTRRLQADPALEGVGLVIFDEFHERSLNSDLALALCRDSQLGLRDDLKILIMSATLDGAPLAERLGSPLLTSEGRNYPVEVHYGERESSDLVATTAAAIRRALRETSGDILAFLPGAREINRCREALGQLDSLAVQPLYAALPFPAQEQAINPGEQRKVVLATNIAETSLTIQGIQVVVDSGFAREPRFDPASGLTRLALVRISRASADQRAGRAGRLGPGTCYRLWSRGTHGSLLPFTPPEIRNADLAPLALELANWGIQDARELTWLAPPPYGALAAGRQLLQLLGAMSESGQLTPLGRQVAKLPIHPRLGCLLLTAQKFDCLSLGCDLVALLSEPGRNSDKDPVTRLEDLRRGGGGTARADNSTFERAARYWRRYFKLNDSHDLTPITQEVVGKLLAAAFPDRIGRLRPGETQRYHFVSGQGGRLPEHSPLAKSPYIVAAELVGKRAEEGLIVQAVPLSSETIFALQPDSPWQHQTYWDTGAGRVIGREVRKLGNLVLAERPVQVASDEANALLLDVIRNEGLSLLNWSHKARTLQVRIGLVRQVFPHENWPELSDVNLLKNIETWLLPFIVGVTSSDALKKIDMENALRSQCDWQQLQRLDKLVPEKLAVASGSQIRIDYLSAEEPILAVKLQEMFGTAETPTVAAGRIPLVLHLLSPAGRPLQVTSDLHSFWNDVYPEVKKEMKGRYPKHPWPDDPWNAVATRHTKRRM